MSSGVRFLIGLIGMAIVIMTATLFLSKAGIITMPSFLTATLLGMTLSTALIYFFLGRTRVQHPLNFVHTFLMTVVLKIILSGVYVFAILRIDPALANANVAFFIVNYFLFTTYEITWLVIQKNAE